MMLPYLPGFAFIQFHPLVPLVDVVRILAQQDAVEKQGPACDQLLKASQAQFQVHVIYIPNKKKCRQKTM